jgi:hypothetical protein
MLQDNTFASVEAICGYTTAVPSRIPTLINGASSSSRQQPSLSTLRMPDSTPPYNASLATAAQLQRRYGDRYSRDVLEPHLSLRCGAFLCLSWRIEIRC